MKRRAREKEKNWKRKTFLCLMPCTHKRHMNVFPLHFMWAAPHTCTDEKVLLLYSSDIFFSSFLILIFWIGKEFFIFVVHIYIKCSEKRTFNSFTAEIFMCLWPEPKLWTWKDGRQNSTIAHSSCIAHIIYELYSWKIQSCVSHFVYATDSCSYCWTSHYVMWFRRLFT